MSMIERSQIDLINNNRIPPVIAMMVASALIYFMLCEQAQSPALTFWLAMILLVDVFLLYAAISFKLAKANDRVNYRLAEIQIVTGATLSGISWGALAFIMMPSVDIKGVFVIFLALCLITVASTMSLAYRWKFSVLFILLVLMSLMLSLPLQQQIIGPDLLVYELSLLLLTVFLIKLARDFSQGIEQMLALQISSQEQKQELGVQRERAEFASRAKSDLLAKMSHELRTPMHAILGFSSLGAGKVGTAPDDKILSYFSRINDSGQRLLLLINDLLDLSKLEAGRMDFDFTTNDLQRTIQNVINELLPLFEERSLSVVLKTSSVDTIAVYDDDRIGQVVRNLLSNAIKFAAEKSVISLYFEAEELELPGNASHTKKVPAIAVSVFDKGVVIPEDELETVFNVFVQSREKETGTGGTGLGLSICREIIGYHNGQIKASNAAGGSGVIFTFVLPYKRIEKHVA